MLSSSHSTGTIIVRVVTLSDLYRPFRDQRVLIKLDIEGGEISVLREFTESNPGLANVLVVGELHNWPEHKAEFLAIMRDANWTVSFFSEDSICVLFHAAPQ
jgi:hypothetical protein